jgi:hypothetical protein
MIFVSSDGPIVIQDIHVQRKSFIVVGEMATETIAGIAKIIGASFSGEGHLQTGEDKKLCGK